jgi:hypothetical protein
MATGIAQGRLGGGGGVTTLATGPLSAVITGGFSIGVVAGAFANAAIAGSVNGAFISAVSFSMPCGRSSVAR